MERTTIVEKKSFTNFRETNPYLKTHSKIFVIKKDPTAGSPTKTLLRLLLPLDLKLFL